jgi:hypothetical protein
LDYLFAAIAKVADLAEQGVTAAKLKASRRADSVLR